MSKEFLKRVVPFAAALTLGLFIASFFVTVAAPRISFKRSERRQHQHRKVHKLERENQRLRESLAEAQMRLAEMEMRRTMEIESNFDVAPPVPVAPERIR